MSRPEQAGQSNLTADAGAQMWKTYLEPLHAQNVRLGSPATSSGPSGKIWLQDFLTACAGACTVDFVALRSSTAILNQGRLPKLILRLVWNEWNPVH